MAIISFDGRVNIAVRIVSEKYPNAQLLEASGVAMNGATTNPDQVEGLRVVFANDNNTTVIIKETSFNEFAAPQLIQEPYLGNVVLDWPVKMDLAEANTLKEAAGYTKPFNSVVLRHPLVPSAKHPYFIFGIKNEPFVFVDTVTKEVHSGH